MARKSAKLPQLRLNTSEKAKGATMLDFIGTHSVAILIGMALIMGFGFAIDHALAQFESEESECNANWLD